MSDHTVSTLGSSKSSKSEEEEERREIANILDDAERVLKIDDQDDQHDDQDSESVSTSATGDLRYMTVEAMLTRTLGIRFIDARNMTTEAKLTLDIKGYPTLEMKQRIVEYCTKKFKNDYTPQQQLQLQEMATTLDECCKSVLSSSQHSRGQRSLKSSMSAPGLAQLATNSRGVPRGQRHQQQKQRSKSSTTTTTANAKFGTLLLSSSSNHSSTSNGNNANRPSLSKVQDLLRLKL